MKRYLLPILLIAGSTAFAQTPFLTKEYLDVNKIKAVHMLHGDMWRDPDSGEPSMEFPQGTGKQANYSGAIWTSARDNTGKLYTSAALYPVFGVDFWPGPLNAAGSLDHLTSQKWAKFWKLNQKDITDFQALSTRTVSTVPAVILEWPAKGNIYAKGATGSLLSITYNMAPFVDVNSDGIYNALDGDYPKMKGDQMLWWVFSDNGPSHTMSNGQPLKIEYHASAYAYNREGDAGRILFYEFVMHNKSGLKYEDFRFGVFSEADLGNPFDDYIAFDSSHRMGIEYNAGKTDKPYGIKSYGNHPPVTGLSLLEMPGDINPGPFAAAGTFNIFYASAGPDEYAFDERVDSQYYNLMHSKSNLGADRPFGDYAYPISKGAVQCDEVHPMQDRRFILSTGNYVFYPGTTAKVVMAFMVTDTTGEACPGMDFGPITRLADTAWDIYRNPRTLSHKENMLAALGLKIWPNPASQQVYINTRVMPEELQVSVYDQLGRRMNVPVQRDATLLTLDISALAPGMYSLHCSNSSGHYSELLLKK